MGIRLSIAAATLAMATMAVPLSAQDAPEPAKKEKKICKTEKMTGSLTRRSRICRTRAEWDALTARSRDGVQDFQNSASGSQVTPICDASGQGPGCQPFGSGGL